MLHATAAKWKATAVLLLLAGLALGGGMATYHLLVPRPDDADVKMFGSEADARRYAEQMVRFIAVKKQGSAAGNVGKARRGIVSMKAELDRKSGQWTVIGSADVVVSKRGPPDPGSPLPWMPTVEAKVVETEWKLVVWYTPSTNAWTLSGRGVELSAGDMILLAPDDYSRLR
jgi:hypothetical protein